MSKYKCELCKDKAGIVRIRAKKAGSVEIIVCDLCEKICSENDLTNVGNGIMREIEEWKKAIIK